MLNEIDLGSSLYDPIGDRNAHRIHVPLSKEVASSNNLAIKLFNALQNMMITNLGRYFLLAARFFFAYGWSLFAYSKLA